MMMDSPFGSGSDAGPIAANNYKKAVYRAPPSRFYVEMLSPVKQDGSYSYGMRISAINQDGSSIFSKRSHSEYEVWRRWEDCLWFQELIELEYSRMARSKRSRLVKGRGVKKNGIYIHDQAASFESLPPGPDPNSVARDIHEFVPKLTKRATVFRASQATIDQRFREFKNLIQGLFRNDAPSLLVELREQRLVTDFFGFWRRDHDLALKQARTAAKQPRHSISSSIFASYFSASSPSLSKSDFSSPNPSRPPFALHIPRLNRPVSTSPPSSSRASFSSRSSRSSDEDVLRRSSSLRASSSPSPREPSTPVAIHQEVPIVFEQHTSDCKGPSSGLEPLPEDRVLIGPVSFKPKPPPHLRARRTSGVSAQENRNCQIFSSPPNLVNHDEPSPSHNRPIRESWQTTTSVSSYLDSLDVKLQHPSEPSYRSSVATFMTDASADAIIPRSESPQTPLPPLPRRSSSASSGQPRALSEGEYDDDMIEAYFYDPYTEPRSPQSVSDSRPVTALGHLSFASISTTSSQDHITTFFRPESSSSGSTSMSSDPPGSPGGNVVIKAVLNNSIVMLRVPRNTSFEEMRKRLYDKFVGQEGVPLSEFFTVAYILPVVAPASNPSKAGKERARSDSLSSVGISDCTQMQFVRNEAEWEQVILPNSSTKLTLRILDTPA